MRHAFKIVAVAGALSLLAVGCGRPADTKGSTATGGKELIACMVLDTGGVDDHSFNQSSWAGMQAANKANPNIKISYVASNSQNDYEPNLTNETNKGCDTVIAVGGLMADAVAKVAKANRTSSTPRSTPARPARTSTACSTTPRRAASSAATWPRR